jgi:hypothetical protein
MSGQLHALATLPPGIEWKGGWEGPRVSLDAAEKRKISSPIEN